MDVVDSIKLLRLSFPPEIHPPPLFIPRRYDRSFSNTPHSPPPPPPIHLSFHRFYHPLIARLAYLYDTGVNFYQSVPNQRIGIDRSIDRLFPSTTIYPFVSIYHIYISRLQPTYYFDNRVSIIIKQSSESRNTCISQAFDCQSSIALSFYRWSRWCRFNR